MRLAHSPFVRSAVSINPSRSKIAPAHAEQRARHAVSVPSLLTTVLLVIGIALCSVTKSSAQEAASASDPQGIASSGGNNTNSQVLVDPFADRVSNAFSNDDTNNQATDNSQPVASPQSIYTPSANDIMGFEYTTTWNVLNDGYSPDFNVKSTTMRTQGKASLAVINPQQVITLTSRPVAYSAQGLAGVGNSGALLQFDIQLPSQCKNENDAVACAPAKAGWVEGFVTAGSRGLYYVPIGRVAFEKYRAGIFNTIDFSIPESVSSSLKGAKFSDLIFEFVVSSPTKVVGTYLFDNLRVHSVEMVQPPTGSAPPAGYGGSLSVLVLGNKPFTESFALNPTQIPSGFHLKKGTTGKTTVQFELGLDSTPTTSCSYIPESTDSSDQSYVLKSCTAGYRAGDIVSANWVNVAIEQGISTQELDAQLVVAPLGQMTGSGLIPPMPTFWGNADTCTPQPVKGKVVTKSTSCLNQTKQANTIITNYFNEVNATHPSPNWIVAPVPESALRHGSTTPTNYLHPATIGKEASPADDPENDTSFNTGGDLNPGGTFDAYWKLSGNLEPTAVTGTDENTTHFDATFTAHGVLFGDDVDVLDAKLTADTDSGETTPAFKAATSTGTLGFYVFGEEIPSGGVSLSPSEGYSHKFDESQAYDLPPIQVWIFSLTLGADLDASVDLNMSAAISGADLSVTPAATLGAHLSGGIDLGIASGSVEAKVNLVTLSAPVTAQAKFVINTDPLVCATTLNGSVKADLDVSSGGGEVDLNATLGPCPLCYTESHTLFKWSPIVNKSWHLFNDTLSYQAFGLPASMCSLPIKVNIVSPAAGTTLSAGVPVVLNGLAAPTESLPFYTSTYNWTFTPGAHASTVTVNPVGATSASPVVTFGAPKSGTTSTWTIGLTATTKVQSQGGAILTNTATAAPVQVTVTSVQPGDYITQVMTARNGAATPDPAGGFLDVGNAPGAITINGAVAGATGNFTTTFAVSACNDQTPACSDPVPAPFGTITTTGGNTTTPTAVWNGFSGGYFKITMVTTSGNAALGSASVIIFGSELI